MGRPICTLPKSRGVSRFPIPVCALDSRLRFGRAGPMGDGDAPKLARTVGRLEAASSLFAPVWAHRHHPSGPRDQTATYYLERKREWGNGFNASALRKCGSCTYALVAVVGSALPRALL
jgi:hypothetical protein